MLSARAEGLQPVGPDYENILSRLTLSAVKSLEQFREPAYIIRKDVGPVFPTVTTFGVHCDMPQVQRLATAFEKTRRGAESLVLDSAGDDEELVSGCRGSEGGIGVQTPKCGLVIAFLYGFAAQDFGNLSL